MKKYALFIFMIFFVLAFGRTHLLYGAGGEINSKLAAAVARGDIGDIKKALAGGANPNFTDEDGVTPLMNASYAGDIETIKLLIEKGANINATDNSGVTALMNAALSAKNDIETVKILIDKGADIKIRDNNGNSALVIAENKGNSEVAKFLAEADAAGESKLMYVYPIALAFLISCLVMFKFSKVKKKAEKGKPGRDTKVSAAPAGQQRAAPETGPDEKSGTPKALEEQAPAITVPAETMSLIEAVDAADIQAIGRLLEKGVNANVCDRLGWSALMHAANKGNAEAVKLLTDKGADVNFRDGEGRTPLMNAAYAGKLEAVKILLDRRADVNAKDKNGRTALDIADDKGFDKIKNLLLKTGAKEGGKSGDSGENPDIKTRSAILNGKLIEYASAGDAGAVQKLITGGAAPDAADENGMSALMLAANYGHFETAKALLENGANVNFKTAKGINALFLAVNKGHLEICALLVKAGADIHARATNGITPLKLASDKGHDRIAAFLRKAGAAG